MAVMYAKRPAVELHAQESDIYDALRQWYLTPGLQRDLRRAENEAVQNVLELLRSRTAKKEP